MPQNLQKCPVQSLPTEILYTILKAVLDDIVERDRITPSADLIHQVRLGGLQFPRTMALVCRRWQDVVFSAPGLWTRILCVLPSPNIQLILSSQLEKTGSYAVDLTIVSNSGSPDDEYSIFCCIALHVRRLRSLRLEGLSSTNHFHMLAGNAPWLKCLRLKQWKDSRHVSPDPDLFNFDCPTLEILHLDNTITSVKPQWLKENLTHVESVTVSGRCSDESALIQALISIPQRIPCLTFDCVYLLHMPSLGNSLKIGAEKVILRHETQLLAMIDNHCKIIVFQNCSIFFRDQTFPSSSTLEFDHCRGFRLFTAAHCTIKWDGDTVIITNSEYWCIEAILVLLGASIDGHSLLLWPHVTTLKLVAKDKFVMRFPMKMLKKVVHSRSRSGNPWQDDNNGAKPIAVLHVHGGPPLSRHERLWFEKRVGDFVWDYRKKS